MRHLVTPLLLLAALPTGCGIDAEVAEETLEHRIRWQQAPSSEIQDCHTFKLGNSRNVEVDRLQVNFAEGSHHVHLYRSTEPVEDAVFDCFKGIDWKKWSLVLGAQTQAMDWRLPEGVTIPFEPHQQLLAQVHWLNTTDKVEESTIDIAFHTTPDSDEHLGVMFGVNQRVDLAPNAHSRIEHYCQMPQGAKLHAMMGHFHSHGNNYRVVERMPDQATGREIYFSKDEPSFEFKTYFPAHDIAPGAGFQYECGFYNSESFQLTWGSDTHTQEHCNMTAYFSPAERISTLCLQEPSKLAALTPAKYEVRAGQDFTFAVELVSPEATDVTVALESSNPTAVAVPASIVIPAGQKVAAFTAITRRPAQVEISASMNGAKVITPVRVGGLVVSEVFYQTATGGEEEGVQWVELANQSDVAIDLSGYSLGAGTADLLNTRLGLPMMIPAKGCIVVGGPVSGPANYSPKFDLAQDLEPNLSTGGAKAAGIGIFSTSVAGMNPALRPLDLVVYNGESTSLRGPDGQIAPIWPGSTAGGSLRRMTNNVWARSSSPTPGNCEILNALN